MLGDGEHSCAALSSAALAGTCFPSCARGAGLRRRAASSAARSMLAGEREQSFLNLPSRNDNRIPMELSQQTREHSQC